MFESISNNTNTSAGVEKDPEMEKLREVLEAYITNAQSVLEMRIRRVLVSAPSADSNQTADHQFIKDALKDEIEQMQLDCEMIVKENVRDPALNDIIQQDAKALGEAMTRSALENIDKVMGGHGGSFVFSVRNARAEEGEKPFSIEDAMHTVGKKKAELGRSRPLS